MTLVTLLLIIDATRAHTYTSQMQGCVTSVIPHAASSARTKPAPRADHGGKPASIARARRERGCTVVHAGSGAPPTRSQRARAATAAPRAQNKPMGSLR
jgi:hypothetical protein